MVSGRRARQNPYSSSRPQVRPIPLTSAPTTFFLAAVWQTPRVSLPRHSLFFLTSRSLHVQFPLPATLFTQCSQAAPSHLFYIHAPNQDARNCNQPPPFRVKTVCLLLSLVLPFVLSCTSPVSSFQSPSYSAILLLIYLRGEASISPLGTSAVLPACSRPFSPGPKLGVWRITGTLCSSHELIKSSVAPAFKIICSSNHYCSNSRTTKKKCKLVTTVFNHADYPMGKTVLNKICRQPLF